MRYLDPVILAKLKNCRLGLSRHRAEGHLSGRHRGVQLGFSQEFAQHREYAPGDELKFLDWKLYARKDRYFVRQFQEDVSLQTYLLADASGSMAYHGSGLVSKWDHACGLAAGLAYLVLAQGDAAGLVTFGAGQDSFLPPSSRPTHLKLIDSALARTRPRGEADLDGVLRRIFGLVSRRSLIVLVSDLLGNASRVMEAAKVLRSRKHEVFVLQVLDPTERDLDLDGAVRFEGLELGDSLRCEVALLRQRYRDEFAAVLRRYEAGFRSSDIPYAASYTDVPWDDSLLRFLGMHRAVR